MALSLLLKCPQRLPISPSEVRTPCCRDTGPSDLALVPPLCDTPGPPWAALQAIWWVEEGEGLELDLLGLNRWN